MFFTQKSITKDFPHGIILVSQIAHSALQDLQER
jgi:hypothetical protein